MLSPRWLVNFRHYSPTLKWSTLPTSSMPLSLLALLPCWRWQADKWRKAFQEHYAPQRAIWSNCGERGGGRCVICYVSMGAPTPTFPLCPRQVQILVNVKPEDFKHYWSFYHCVKRSYENTPVQLTIIKCHINAILQNHTIRDNTTQYQTTMPSFHF